MAHFQGEITQSGWNIVLMALFIIYFTNNLKNRRIISIVGTRQITSYGTEFCRKLKIWRLWILWL
jgi:hypothetical protein